MLKKILGAFLVLVSILAISSQALYVRTGDSVFIPQDMVINDNLFAAGENVTVLGKVTGDLIAFGGRVVLGGDVDGNIIAGGGEIAISGNARNIFIGGGEVMVSGVARNDLLVGCGDLYLEQNARVGKDAFIGCGEANIAGKIYRDLKIGGGTLVIEPSALIKGKLDHSVENIDISGQARIVGPITSFSRPEVGKEATRFFAALALGKWVLTILTILILGILAIVFLPNQVKLVASRMRSGFWSALGWGMLSFIVIPLLVVLLFVTIIGIPLGILLSVAYIFGAYVAAIFTSVVIGQWVFGKLKKPEISLIWALFVGFAILQLIGLVPIVGWIARLVLFFWAFGALVASRFMTYKEAREKGIY